MKKEEDKHEVVKGRSYQEAYNLAKQQGKLKRKTFRIHTWSEENAHITGRILSITEFKGGKFDAVVNAYTIDTDDGLISCILGSATDGQLEGIDLVDQLVHIEFCGQKKLDDGRSVNIFNVDILK